LLKLDMQLRHELFILFKEIIRVLVNAGAGTCKIYARMEKSNLLYNISFNNLPCNKPALNALTEKLEHNKYAVPLRPKCELQTKGNTCILTIKMPVV